MIHNPGQRQRVRCLYGCFNTRKKACAKYIPSHPHRPIISHNPENPIILKILIQTAFPAHSPHPPIPGVGANHHSPNVALQDRLRDGKCGNIRTGVISRKCRGNPVWAMHRPQRCAKITRCGSHRAPWFGRMFIRPYDQHLWGNAGGIFGFCGQAAYKPKNLSDIPEAHEGLQKYPSPPSP